MKRSRRLRNEALRGRCPGDGVSRMEGDVAYADSSLLCRIRSVGDAEKTLPTITTDVVSISNETGTEDVAKYVESMRPCRTRTASAAEQLHPTTMKDVAIAMHGM